MLRDGYFFDQVTGDSRPGAWLGPFLSRVAGIGPQIGYLVPIGGMQGFIGMKAYKEFGAQNRGIGVGFLADVCDLARAAGFGIAAAEINGL